MIMKDKLNTSNTDTALVMAWENWRQEIQIYWQRALYFFGFISIIGAGYLQVKIYIPNQHILSLLFSLLITFLSFSWYLSNRGSKFWQENWELHIKELEKTPLMNNVLYKPLNNKRIISSYPFSPYKLNTLVSLVMFLFCCTCALYEVCNILEFNIPETKWVAVLIIPFIYFIIKMPKMLKFRRFKQKN